ncbi:MAG: hypothetical protein SGI86_19700 [Deltaproteobacteria bacterium]|nr:hypothetical protein [Deltaproteobacteria bacterium]
MNHSKQKNEDLSKSDVGTGVGALGGAAAGAALGTLIPGVGNIVGAVIGGAVGLAGGAAAGRAIGASINPKAEEDYWRTNHSSRSYASGSSFDDYAPAYRYGWESRGREPTTRRFEDAEPTMGKQWESNRGNSKLGWDKAKHASREAWDRIERALPGDSDGDGK